MRLLNTTTLEFKEYLSEPPRCAILSHRWEGEEVSFEEYSLILECHSEPKEDMPTYLRNRAKRSELTAGYRKILNFCSCARTNGLDWAWVDTCCIDKKSSAELSEAINSMLTWYEHAQECYVFLSDVSAPERAGELPDLSRSQWFRRGWTLQELLAPNRLVIYAEHWDKIDLARTTIILRKVLVCSGGHKSASVAQRMSWAAGRATSRVEDISYCLLGLFGINMPLLYGEGTDAFQRLQREIITRYQDFSILTWTMPCWLGHTDSHRLTFDCVSLDALARSPNSFEDCGNMRTLAFTELSPSDVPIQIANRRLEFYGLANAVAIDNSHTIEFRRRHLFFVLLRSAHSKPPMAHVSEQPVIILLGETFSWPNELGPTRRSRSFDAYSLVTDSRVTLTSLDFGGYW
ncbi:hypothetical protein LTR78_009270 [Recurvomyces mirabilis]|uniref:Heterokaryon incompatibility domain-containing protein n=1 Tax=Recurvomyces mirabilis TaxID=574656 RepID=A0AAE0TRV9_9PEZI|nr:hypothetical protein LTR78_009270 [Recurvomyces mirabilis]KAK5156169.1 hypothetical protein LTS14_005056 [Recurvomyces mirabilis]